jgi:hypothetical protein
MPPKPAISPSVPPTKKKKKTKKTNNEIFLLVEEEETEEEEEEEGFIVVVFLCLRVCVVRVCVSARACVLCVLLFCGTALFLGFFFLARSKAEKVAPRSKTWSKTEISSKNPTLINISFLPRTKKASTGCTSSSLVCTARLQRA